MNLSISSLKTSLLSILLFINNSLLLAGTTGDYELPQSSHSYVFPILLKAIKKIVSNQKELLSPLELEIETILEKNGVSRQFLSKVDQKFSSSQKNNLANVIPEDEIEDPLSLLSPPPYTPISNIENKIALHLYRFDVVNPSDDLLGDNIYLYFIVTDGIIATGRVTDTYQGFRKESSFFLSEDDRVLYPIGSKIGMVPKNDLILDFGVVESDGDDIKELQNISKSIIEITSLIYSVAHLDPLKLIYKLRQEIKNLSSALLVLNNDDKLYVGTLHFRKEFIDRSLNANPNENLVEFTHNISGKEFLGKWAYRLNFRLIKDPK